MHPRVDYAGRAGRTGVAAVRQGARAMTHRGAGAAEVTVSVVGAQEGKRILEAGRCEEGAVRQGGMAARRGRGGGGRART
jgi:hypothetical protein